MGARKIVDDGEVVRWFAEGRTLAWMVEEYRRKYDLQVGSSMFGNFRRRRGLERRIQHDDALIPWRVMREHRWAYAVTMLRSEGRRRSGFPVAPSSEIRLDAWLRNLRDREEVISYDPSAGFASVPRRPGVDADIIREPLRKTTRRNAD